jgi:AAA ATPase domain
MDPRTNPYAPGAGTPPPELAGRDAAIEQAAVALDRIRARRTARSVIFYGLRGVGKTVLLNQIRGDAEARGIQVVRMEAPEERSLPALLAPPLRAALLRLDRGAAVKARVGRALSALAGFISLKVKYQDIELALDADPEKGLADSGDLDNDLGDLITAVGEAAAEQKTAIVLFLDELQYVPENELAALIMALHNATSQNQLPVTMVAAGLPQLLGRMGRAKSYSERLFEFVSIGRLDAQAATAALCVPAEKEGATFDADAIAEILRRTDCYPYFLQEWGKHSWNVAERSPINLADAKVANQEAINELDASFFRVRFDRLTPSEKRYMRAMAEMGPGPHRSGEVADLLHKKVTATAPTRNALITKGMIYSPAHGDTAFTVPLFDGFMKRTIPDFTPKS